MILEIAAHTAGGAESIQWQEMAAAHRRGHWANVRDRTLKAVGVPRSVIPGLDLKFSAPRVRYDIDRDLVTFSGEAGGTLVYCAVRGEASRIISAPTAWIRTAG